MPLDEMYRIRKMNAGIEKDNNQQHLIPLAKSVEIFLGHFVFASNIRIAWLIVRDTDTSFNYSERHNAATHLN